jgi:hypothetical protein
MARRVICPKCYRDFTPAQYQIHKFAHTRDEFSQKDPVDLPTSRLLPIEVPDDSDEAMEDTFEAPVQATDCGLSPNDNHFSDNHENTSSFIPYDDPFSDNHAATSADLLPPNTPIATTSHAFLPSTPGDEDMDVDPSPGHSEDSSAQGPASGWSSPLIDEDLGFEDSGLDPTFSGHPSLSEQLKDHFLAGYHGGGE